MKEPPDNTGFLTQYSKRAFVRLVLLSSVVSLAFIVLLGGGADWSELFSTLDWGWLAIAAGALTVMQFVSGYRLYCLLPAGPAARRGQYLNSVKVMFRLQALLKLLPFRLGEAAFFWMAQKELGLSFRENLGVFLCFRIWDFRVVSLSFLLFGGLMFRGGGGEGQPVFIMVGAFGALMFFLSSHKVAVGAAMLFRCLHSTLSFHWADRAANTFMEAAASLKSMKSVRGSVVAGGLTGAIWLIYFFVFFSLFNCVGVPVGWSEAVAVASGMILVGILPIQTIGGIGLMELGQASLLVLAGLSPSMAASKSLAVGGLFLGLCLAVPALLTVLFALRARCRADW